MSLEKEWTPLTPQAVGYKEPLMFFFNKYSLKIISGGYCANWQRKLISEFVWVYTWERGKEKDTLEHTHTHRQTYKYKYDTNK